VDQGQLAAITYRFCSSRARRMGSHREATMKACYAIALSAAAGVVIGAAAVQTLHAQAKPPIFMVAINEITSEEGYTKEYLPEARKAIKDYGGIYIAAGPAQQIAGNLPNGRVVILKWESMEALMKWRNSPEYQATLKKGEKYAKYNIIGVDGVQP
jgi:uncharacterized protein (DUF1330 family)